MIEKTLSADKDQRLSTNEENQFFEIIIPSFYFLNGRIHSSHLICGFHNKKYRFTLIKFPSLFFEDFYNKTKKVKVKKLSSVYLLKYQVSYLSKK